LGGYIENKNNFNKKKKNKRIRTKLKKITNHKLGLKVKLKTNKIFIKGLRKKNQKSKGKDKLKKNNI
jgi:hypothetical protein